jgi:hypothetical protein
MKNARFFVMAAAALLAPSLLHCAKSNDGSSGFGDDVADAAPDGARRSMTPVTTFDEAGALPQGTADCVEATKQIFVLGSDKSLYRFYPDMLKFTRIGTVACPTGADTFSMAIDRGGIAWVEYTDGRVYAVDTNNASCTPTPFVPHQTGFNDFGMGYARNGDTPTGETLYVAGAGLASLDTKTFQLTFLGSLTFDRTELTSLDTQLYAFSVGSGVIAALDKATAATTKVYRTSAVDEQAAFAFAQWGGFFWIFTGDDHSIVTKYDPATDISVVAVQNTGMLIVGAGSSTCAPTTPPR